MLTWEISESSADDFSDFIRQTWEYSYDTYARNLLILLILFRK